MAKTILTNAFVSVSGTDISDHVESVQVTMSVADVDITSMGATSHAHAPGLRDDSIQINFFQDFNASVHGLLNALMGVAAGGVVVVRGDKASASTTNPSFTMTGVLFDYSPINASVGTASMTQVTFRPAQGSQITVATT